MSKSNIKDVEVLFCHSTDKAYGVWKDEDDMRKEGKVIWLPKSMVEMDGEQLRGNVVEVSAPENLLIEKGLL